MLYNNSWVNLNSYSIPAKIDLISHGNHSIQWEEFILVESPVHNDYIANQIGIVLHIAIITTSQLLVPREDCR